MGWWVETGALLHTQFSWMPQDVMCFVARTKHMLPSVEFPHQHKLNLVFISTRPVYVTEIMTVDLYRMAEQYVHAVFLKCHEAAGYVQEDCWLFTHICTPL